MKNEMKLLAAMAMAFAGMLGSNSAVDIADGQTIIECECGNTGCGGRCRLRHRNTTCSDCGACQSECECVQCPQCETCRLELDHSNVKKTCFKVEQKAVCIPPVRLPWKRDCPPGISKTRTVNQLKKHTYECPNCSYKWTLQKPEATPTLAGHLPPIIRSASQDNQVPTGSPQSTRSWRQGVSNVMGKLGIPTNRR